MHPEFRSLHQQISQQIHRCEQQFKQLDESLLNEASPTQGWSIGQCIWHLNSYSNYYLPLLKKARSANHATFAPGWLGAWFTNLMQPGKGRFKAFQKHVPPQRVSAQQEVAMFIQDQLQLLQWIESADDAKLNARIPISISRVVKLKAGDVVAFLVAHQERHLQQAERNLLNR